MTLQNYSRYEITINGDRLFIKNTQTGNVMTPITDRYHASRKYTMIDDNGNKKQIPELRIAFALMHGVPLHKLPRTARFYGSVSNPVIGKRDTPKYSDNAMNRLLELEQSLDMLKYAYYSKDYSRLIEFAYANKKAAIGAVSKRIFVSYGNLEKYWDYGLDMFLSSIKDLKFTSLKPLMNYLCTCLKYGYLRNRDKVIFEDIPEDKFKPPLE